jgi:hypothetical protein
MFFAEENNSKIIENFLSKAKNAKLKDEVKIKRLDNTLNILNSIHHAPKDWDDRCKFNIKTIGQDFIQQLNKEDFLNPKFIDQIYSSSYRFLVEFYFFVGSEKELSMELMSLMNSIEDDQDDMDKRCQEQIKYAKLTMPSSIFQSLINDRRIESILGLEELFTQAENKKKEWDKEIDEKKAEVSTLKDSLSKYETAFNFVGLGKGFHNLNRKKEKEANWLLFWLLVTGMLMLAPLGIETWFLLFSTSNHINSEYIAFLPFPLISIEIILIYFFRIILMNHKSAKAQIIQIELRQTLCQFIQHYTEYSGKIKSKDKTALEKFENLIFSGILTDSEKLPSTFDGLDQFGNFIKKVKN